MATPAQRLESERALYPAMQVDEILVWREWLKLHQADYQRFDYNVRIGTGLDPGPAFADNVRKMAVQITQLRIDAVGWVGSSPTIFEVKRFCQSANVGQLLTYLAVWKSQALSATPPAGRLVCAAFNPNILPLVTQSGLTLDQVTVDFTELAPRRIPTP